MVLDGETGLLITEFTSVWPEKRVITTSVWDDRFIPGLSRIPEAVHDAGAPVFMQIAALGGKSYVEPFAPSAVESELYEQVPREMTVPEIENMVECFVRGAERAQRGGTNMAKVYDAIVIGAGVVGASTAFHLARDGGLSGRV